MSSLQVDTCQLEVILYFSKACNRIGILCCELLENSMRPTEDLNRKKNSRTFPSIEMFPEGFHWGNKVLALHMGKIQFSASSMFFGFV